jgi:serine/threonine protein kinase
MHQGGTLAYFSPECFEGVTSAKLDVWAAGVILFYLLSGMVYFNANTKS